MKAIIIAATLLLFILGCAPRQSDQLNQQQKDQIKNEAKAVIDSITAKVERFDGIGALQYFWDSPEFVMYNPDGSRSDFQAIKKSFTDELVNVAAVKSTTVREEFPVVAKDFVIYSWVGKEEDSMKSGLKITEDPDALTWVFKKVDGQWKVICLHNSATITTQKAGKK